MGLRKTSRNILLCPRAVPSREEQPGRRDATRAPLFESNSKHTRARRRAMIPFTLTGKWEGEQSGKQAEEKQSA